MASVAIRINQKDLARLDNIVTKRLPESLGDGMQRFGDHLVQRLRNNLMDDPLRPTTPNRAAAQFNIEQKRLSKYRSHIVMPQSLIYLDAMKPHYVALRKGRNITKWAQANFDGTRVSGRSDVWMGKTGVKGGFLFVTPHKFVQKSMAESVKILPNELRKGIKKAFKSSSKMG